MTSAITEEMLPTDPLQAGGGGSAAGTRTRVNTDACRTTWSIPIRGGDLHPTPADGCAGHDGGTGRLAELRLDIHPVFVSGIAQSNWCTSTPSWTAMGGLAPALHALPLYGRLRLQAPLHHQRVLRPRLADLYRSLQAVREQDMDLTGWLDYFITGLEPDARGARAQRAGDPP